MAQDPKKFYRIKFFLVVSSSTISNLTSSMNECFWITTSSVYGELKIQVIKDFEKTTFVFSNPI